MAAGLALAVALGAPAGDAVAADAAQAVTAPPQATATQAREADGLHVQDLATRYADGYPQYRIPALAATTRGTLIAAYDARPSMDDLPGHIAVVIRRSTDGGGSWGPQQLVRQAPAPAGFGDPSLIVDRHSGRIFLFYAASINEGFWGAHRGNRPDDPDVQQADYSYSDDDGLSWHARRITPEIKNPAWGGLFASSGEGIQLQQGPHAGRLVQQYVLRIGGKNFAASAYSDDAGQTWKMGRPVGPGMDENKSVELADGSLLLDVRARPKRLFAISHDGGESWSTPQPVPALTDPGNNGSIIRYAPNAPASAPEAHWLLESNTDDPDIRRNLVVRMSCDDGRHWPIVKVVDPGSAAYSTLTLQPQGRIGLLYERDGYRALSYTSFDLAWLGGVCAPLSAAAPAITAGSRSSLRVTVSNQSGQRLDAGRLALEAPQGWSAAAVPVGPIAAGGQVTIDLPYTASTAQAGEVPLTLQYTTQGQRSSLQLSAAVTATPTAPAAPSLTVLPVLDHLDAAGPAGLPGDVASYLIRVSNTGNVVLRDVRLAGNLEHLSKCALASLAPGASQVCRAGTHRLSDDDQRQGRYVPRVTASAVAPDGAKASVTASGAGIELPMQ